MMLTATITDEGRENIHSQVTRYVSDRVLARGGHLIICDEIIAAAAREFERDPSALATSEEIRSHLTRTGRPELVYVDRSDFEFVTEAR